MASAELAEELKRACGPNGRNRASALSEALELWLTQRRIEALQQAYHQPQPWGAPASGSWIAKPDLKAPQRGRLYTWPHKRAFGDSKARPVLVIAPDAATRSGNRAYGS